MAPPPLIDTHIHLWDLSAFRYPWLEEEEWAAIRSDYRVAELTADAAGLDVRGYVHVQADVDRAVDPVEEVAWVASQVAAAPAGFPPLACIGYADLRAADLGPLLGRYAAHALVRGIRQEAWYDPASDLPGVLTTNLLEDPAWLAGLRTLAAGDLSFELLVAAHQLSQAADVFAELPDLPVVLEHTGVPALDADGEPPPGWREGLRAFAARVPWAVLKISAMGFMREDWSLPDVAPIVRECVDVFGAERCMLGSNHPVERPSCAYRPLWEAYDRILRDLPATQRAALFHDTAARVYRLDAPSLTTTDGGTSS